MAYKKDRKQKDPIIELSPNCEKAEIEIYIGILRPTYTDMKCCMGPNIVFKWGDLYQIF
jgi:hypothetical protein